jgi:hypothetical protein
MAEWVSGAYVDSWEEAFVAYGAAPVSSGAFRIKSVRNYPAGIYLRFLHILEETEKRCRIKYLSRGGTGYAHQKNDRADCDHRNYLLYFIGFALVCIFVDGIPLFVKIPGGVIPSSLRGFVYIFLWNESKK